jgi:hypothetical protein
MSRMDCSTFVVVAVDEEPETAPSHQGRSAISPSPRREVHDHDQPPIVDERGERRNRRIVKRDHSVFPFARRSAR